MKIHCIGIGGIGLSALARHYISEGNSVSGSDATRSAITDSLEQEGVIFYQGHNASHIEEGVEKVVYSVAVTDSNPELEEAKKRGIAVRTYPEALGELTQQKTTIAICGTHGKTTTTAMMYYAMKACGVNPTVIVGSLLAEGETNYIAGDSEYLIVEACEYKRSFLNLHPTHIVVTNIDADHLDYYKNIEDIYEAFRDFMSLVKETGTIVTHSNITYTGKATHVTTEFIEKDRIPLRVLGPHNRENASLVLRMLTALNYKEEKIKEGLLAFPGTWRRMEYKGMTTQGVPVYDDYGHHPKEIQATMLALKEKYTNHTHIIFFQPHLHSRTKALFDDFVHVLSLIDIVYILPIYKAREEDTTVVSEEELVSAINKNGGNAYMATFSQIPSLVAEVTDPHSVIVNMGAGNAFEVFNQLSLSS